MNSFTAILVCSLAALSVVSASTKTSYSAQAGLVHSAWPAAPVHQVLAAPAPAPIVAAPLVNTGSSSQFRQEDSYGNSQFGYDESHATGGTSRREEIINGVVRGSYSLSEADGRRRMVHYIADNDGFRASIQTNEPGVEPKDPADVLINKSLPVAAVAVAAAPAPIAVAAPAPLPVPAPVLAAAPAPLPVPALAPIKGYSRLALPSTPVASLSAAPLIVEQPTPRSFSYSVGVSHLASGSAPAPIHLAAPVLAHRAPLAPLQAAPIVQEQQQLIDY